MAAARRRLRHRALPVLLCLLGCGSAGLAAAGPAAAHAEVLQTVPGNGTRLQAAPAAGRVRFSEPVELSPDSLRLVAADGHRVATAEPFHPGGAPDQVAVRLPAALPDGSYSLWYGLVSQDGHPITGAFSFVIGDGPLVDASGSLDDAGADPLVAFLHALSRWAALAGLALVGGLVLLVAGWPDGRGQPRARRLLHAGFATAAAATLLGLLLQGPYATRRGPAAVLDPAALASTLELPVGRVLLLRLVALLALAAVVPRLLAPARPDQAPALWRPVAMVLGLALLAGYAGAGHAGSGSQPTTVVLSNIVHLAAMSVWLGGLVLVAAVALPAGAAAAAPALRGFSPLAAGSVLVVVLTGTYQAWLQVDGLGPLVRTRYGLLLLAKLAVVAGVLALAGLARRQLAARLVPAAAGPGPAGPAPSEHPGGPASSHPGSQQPGPAQLSRLRLLLAGELALAALVLLVSALLMATAPAREAAVGTPLTPSHIGVMV